MPDQRTSPPVTRRCFIATTATAVATTLGTVPRRAPAQTGHAKPFAGTTLSVAAWSGPYPKFLADYLPDFEEATGIKVSYETPAFPVYNQRADLELSTKGSAYDVLNLTFIYTSRWIGAGWFTPLTEFLSDRNRTPPDWDSADFLPGAVEPLKDRKGQIYAFPWIADAYMAASARYDLVQKAGLKMPDTFDDIVRVVKAIHDKDGVKGFVNENHHGWTWIPYLHGFGGNVFRNPPDDLMPTLDAPEAVEAAEFYSNLLRTYGPDGILSYTYDQAHNTLLQGRANYITFNHAWLVQLGDPAKSKVATTVAYSLMPAGPKGRFPGVASHGFGIPVGSKKKEAAWEFIKWALSKDTMRRILLEKGYGSVTRRSLIDTPQFKQKMTINGYDCADLYLKTIDLAARGHMKYRTDGVPRSIEEAAWLDGGTVWGTFLRITLPLAAPGLAATAVLCFVLSWNDFFYALILTRTQAMTAPVAIVNFMQYEGWEWGKIAAGGTLVMLPVVVFSLLVRNYLVRGLAAGGLKG